MSLRARLLITSVVLVAAGLIVANVATYRFLSSFLIHRVDEQLVSAEHPAADALQFGQRPGPGGPPGGFNVPPGTSAEVRDSSGHTLIGPVLVLGLPGQRPPHLILPSSLPGSSSSSGSDQSIFTAHAAGGGSAKYRVLAVAVGLSQGGQGTFLVGIPLSDVAATLHRLVAVEILVSGVVLLAVAGLALWLVRVGLRPLVGIGETAGAIAAGDLTRRVEPADSRTEVGRLGLALNSMLAQIEAAFEERRASERRLRRFVGDASHELRTPLTSIRGYAELFRRGAHSRPEDLAKAMRRIEDEASRMGVLVDDLLLLARLDQGRPLEREPVDVAHVVTDAVESARAVEPDRPIDLQVSGMATVIGDEGRLRQVVDNLLHNVRLHTPPGTPVLVRVERDQEQVVVSVADEGPGLSPEIAARAFERFYRGDPARSRDTGGAGLGLSIVSAIVEAHGGSVRATSANGLGATFEVTLPARSDDEEDPNEPAAGVSSAPASHTDLADDPSRTGPKEEATA